MVWERRIVASRLTALHLLLSSEERGRSCRLQQNAASKLRQVGKSGHGVSAASPACEVLNIAIVDGEPPMPEEKDHETRRWN